MHGQRQRRPLDIIVDLLFAISSQMLGPTGLKKEDRKRAGSGLGTVLLAYTSLHNCGLL